MGVVRRSALQFAWHYQPETLACYRIHTESDSQIARTGQNARDIRRTIEIFAGLLPADLAALVVPVAQEFHCANFLVWP